MQPRFGVWNSRMSIKEIDKEKLNYPSASHSHCILVFATQLDLHLKILHHVAAEVTYFLSEQGQLALFRFPILKDSSIPTLLFYNLLRSLYNKVHFISMYINAASSL